MDHADQRFEGVHCTISISRPRFGLVVISLSGRDVGEHGDAPFRALEALIAEHAETELFIDARGGKGAALDVSGAWASWLRQHRARFAHVSMLTGSRFIQLSAELVQRFSGLGESMRLYTDAQAYEEALAEAGALH